MFREAKEVDSQTSHAAQYASTLLRPTRADPLPCFSANASQNKALNSLSLAGEAGVRGE
jgi:hypothetical protein